MLNLSSQNENNFQPGFLIVTRYVVLAVGRTKSPKQGGSGGRVSQIRYKEQSGARGVMVIVAGSGHGDTSSNPGRNWLHFT